MTNRFEKYTFINVPIVDKALVRKLEGQARAMQISRAAVVRLALMEYLREKEVKRDDRQPA